MNNQMGRKTQSGGGLIAIIAVNAIPAIIWGMISPLSVRFINLNTTLTSVGQIFGLTGLSLFAMVIILGARIKFLENYFPGMNRIYTYHHLLGGLAFCFLLFHPLWLTAKYLLVSSYSAAIFLLPDLNNPAKSMGGISLFLMIILLGITFYASLKYHIWKLSHQFLGLAFIFAIGHLLLIPSDVSRHPLLRWYMIIITITALIAYLYRVIFSKLVVKKYDYVVLSAIKLKGDVLEVNLAPINKQLEFVAGQYAFFSFSQNGLPAESHPFSFASDSRAKKMAIIVKTLGDYTALMVEQLKSGTRAKIEGPYGKFTAQGDKQVWIAGGIGVTPFLSMIKSLTPNQEVDFFWSANMQEELFYQEELVKITEDNKNIRYFPHTSSKTGFLTADMIISKSGEIEDKEIFVCGPPIMMKSFKEQFTKLGVPGKKIHSEDFSL